MAFAGKTGISASRDRLTGFRNVAEAAGAEVLWHEFETFAPREELKRKLPEWLDAGVTGTFAWIDEFACYLYKALGGHGLKVPRDMSVIGVNDSRASILRPALTTFSLPLEDLGNQAVEMLLSQITSGRPTGERVLYEATMIPAKSTATRRT